MQRVGIEPPNLGQVAAPLAASNAHGQTSVAEASAGLLEESLQPTALTWAMAPSAAPENFATVGFVVTRRARRSTVAARTVGASAATAEHAGASVVADTVALSRTAAHKSVASAAAADADEAAAFDQLATVVRDVCAPVATARRSARTSARVASPAAPVAARSVGGAVVARTGAAIGSRGASAGAAGAVPCASGAIARAAGAAVRAAGVAAGAAGAAAGAAGGAGSTAGVAVDVADHSVGYDRVFALMQRGPPVPAAKDRLLVAVWPPGYAPAKCTPLIQFDGSLSATSCRCISAAVPSSVVTLDNTADDRTVFFSEAKIDRLLHMIHLALPRYSPMFLVRFERLWCDFADIEGACFSTFWLASKIEDVLLPHDCMLSKDDLYRTLLFNQVLHNWTLVWDSCRIPCATHLGKKNVAGDVAEQPHTCFS